MPITITPTAPGNIFTPGGVVYISSDFIGPQPSGSFWTWTLGDSAHEGSSILGGRMDWTSNDWSLRLFVPQSSLSSQQNTGAAMPSNATAKLVVELRDPNGTVIDQGSQTAPWDPTTGLPGQLLDKGGGTSGGLTPEQAAQLAETHQATFPESLTDNLTTQLLPGDPNTGYVGVNLTRPVFGIIIRMTEIAPDLTPDTPDGDYWFTSLAIVRIYRGQDLWIRAPIHTSSKLINLWSEGLFMGLVGLVGTAWLLNLTLQVTFRPGCNGTVYAMIVP